jgi:hypothetical protein
LRQRAGRLAWVRAEAEDPRSPRQLVALEIDVVAEEVRNLLPDSVDVAGPTPSGEDEVGLLRSAEQLHTVTGVSAAGMRLVLGCGWRWWGRRTPVPGLIDGALRRRCWPHTTSWPG